MQRYPWIADMPFFGDGGPEVRAALNTCLRPEKVHAHTHTHARTHWKHLAFAPSTNFLVTSLAIHPESREKAAWRPNNQTKES